MKHDFYPEDFGARADGEFLNSQAMQASVDACHEAGGGRVVCGPGVYLCGSFELKSGVELHLAPGCILRASSSIHDYQKLVSDGFHHELANEKTAYYLIGARQAREIAITGPGIVDGRGPEFYDQTEFRRSGQFATKPVERIRLVMFHRCTGIRLEDGTYLDSPCWTMWLMMCDGIQVHRLKIRSDQRLINSDGIDFDGCRNITVSDCIMDTEDDCLVFRAIQRVHREPAICENFSVSNCVFRSERNSIRISCPNDHITRNGVFSNLVMRGRNGIFFHFPQRFARHGKGGAEVRDLTFSNLHIDCEKYPIRFDVEEGIALTKLARLRFSQLRVRSGEPCLIRGNPETIIEDVAFQGVDFTATGETAVSFSFCRGVRLDQVVINHAPPEGVGKGPRHRC